MDDNDTIKQLFDNKPIIITQIIGHGEVNRVYVVKQDDRQIILRLNSKEELARFNKEAWCLKMALKKGIPSPHLIDLGIKNNTAYMMLSFIVGENGKDTTEDKEKIWDTIGTYAKRIHLIPTHGFGENMATKGNFSDTWERYLSYSINSLNTSDKLLLFGVVTEEQSEHIKEMFLKLREKTFNFALVHGDLSLENVIVRDNDVALIDWGVAESTIVPHMEIIDLLQNQMSDKNPLFDNFLQGYGMKREEHSSTIKPEIDTLTLLQAIDKLRWAIDKKPNQIDEFSLRVQFLIEKQDCV